MKTILKISGKTFLFVLLTFLLTISPGPANAEDNQLEAMNSLLNNKMDWTLSDMRRLVEELRKMEDPWEKRLLVEELELILYKEVEFPFYIHSMGQESLAVDVASKEASDRLSLSELFAKTYAIAGIARAYEGYAAAGESYIEKARKVYAEISTLSLKIDSFEEPLTVQEWMEDARARTPPTNYVQVSFHSKVGTPPLKVLEQMSKETVEFESDNPAMEYELYVAERDFLKGISAGVMTLTPTYIFNIYLPPGKFRLVVDLAKKYLSDIQVYPDPSRNHYLIEGMDDGITVYPSPVIQGMEWEKKSN